jgi:hypothetical protein
MLFWESVMFRTNTLSTWPLHDDLIGGRLNRVTNTLDWEDGGFGINNTNYGLLYQIWNCWIDHDKVIISAPNTNPTVLITLSGLTEVSFTFDQNMHPVLAYVQNEISKLLWYDSLEGKQTIKILDTDVITPRVALDDKRAEQSAVSDIILAYFRGSSLYIRLQRDRFLIEYLLKENINGKLVKIGMNRGMRFEFVIEDKSSGGYNGNN